jgi:hypothetical protein
VGYHGTDMPSVGLQVVLGYSIIKWWGKGSKYTLIFLAKITLCINFRASVRGTLCLSEKLKEQC